MTEIVHNTLSRPVHDNTHQVKEHAILPDSWSDLYISCREKSTRVDNNDEQVCMWFPAVTVQCEMYVAGARQRECTMQIKEDDFKELSRSLKKDLIVQTRYALRFALSCLATAADDTDLRRSRQQEAVMTHHWHKALMQIVSLSRGGDEKIETLAARLCSNLVTGNSETAFEILSSVKSSPSPRTISHRMADALLQTNKPATKEMESNWTDLMLASNGNRDALGAIVATLHNSLVAVSETDRTRFTNSMVSDRVLVCTLLRQILSANSIESHLFDTSPEEAVRKSYADEATEWISLLLEQFSQRGGLPAMYEAVAGCSHKAVLPEQVVLLQCINGAVEEFMAIRRSWHPLGGDVVDGIISTHMFLAQQACSMHKILVLADSTMEMNEKELTKAALTIVLEMLASSLGDDSSSALASIRLRVGQETTLIQDTCNDLGVIVDVLSEKNQGLKARELKISDGEQRWITTIIRVLGNLCFRCRQNQDLIRLTPVPLAKFLPPVEDERTALHFLLSCTSFSYGCFTLREWAIVALRNVLEGNIENQTLVEKLQAQQPLQNVELEKMGLKVDMDEHGNVKVVPIA